MSIRKAGGPLPKVWDRGCASVAVKTGVFYFHRPAFLAYLFQVALIRRESGEELNHFLSFPFFLRIPAQQFIFRFY